MLLMFATSSRREPRPCWYQSRRRTWRTDSIWRATGTRSSVTSRGRSPGWRACQRHCGQAGRVWELTDRAGSASERHQRFSLRTSDRHDQCRPFHRSVVTCDSGYTRPSSKQTSAHCSIKIPSWLCRPRPSGPKNGGRGGCGSWNRRVLRRQLLMRKCHPSRHSNALKNRTCATRAFPSKRQKRKKVAPAALASPPGAQPLSPTTVIGQDVSAVTLLPGANPSFETESGSSGPKEHSLWQSTSKAVQCQYQQEAGTCPVNIRYKSPWAPANDTGARSTSGGALVVANHISAWTVAGEDAQVSFGSCFGSLYRPLIQATLVVMLQHAYGAGLPSIAGGDWQTELEQLLGIPVVEATGAAAAAGDRPVGTL